MATISKTWWGQKFLAALADFTDEGRLARGRAYAGDNRIKKWTLAEGTAKAEVRGNVNPYFGVYKEPTYQVSVKMTALTDKQWQQVIARLSERASFISRLLLNEIPENIETAFHEAHLHLLPNNDKDFVVKCSCPDYAVPCKHIAGVCYRLASLFDQDPFLLFEMRGLSPQKLQETLLKSPLGKVLAHAKAVPAPALTPLDSYYPRPQPVKLPEQISVKGYWQGAKALPKQLEPPQEALISALVIKKGGDYPPFWDKQSSFITVMEDFYWRMRKVGLKGL